MPSPIMGLTIQAPPELPLLTPNRFISLRLMDAELRYWALAIFIREDRQWSRRGPTFGPASYRCPLQVFRSCSYAALSPSLRLGGALILLVDEKGHDADVQARA